MARLNETVKVFIVQRLACFETAQEVITAVKEVYQIDVTPQLLQVYDPTKVNGQNMSKKLKDIFDTTRAKFLDDTSGIPIASKAYRLWMLQRMADKSISKGNAPLAAQLLEQAAKEVGDAYTNKRRLEHAGKDGSELPQGPVIVALPAQLGAEAWAQAFSKPTI